MNQYDITLAVAKIHQSIEEHPQKVGQEYRRSVTVQLPKAVGNEWINSPTVVTFRAVVVADMGQLRWDITNIKTIEGEELI